MLSFLRLILRPTINTAACWLCLTITIMDNAQSIRIFDNPGTLNRLIHKLFVRTWGKNFVVLLCKGIILEGREEEEKGGGGCVVEEEEENKEKELKEGKNEEEEGDEEDEEEGGIDQSLHPNHHNHQSTNDKYFFYPTTETSRCKISHFLQMVADKMALYFNITPVDFFNNYLQLHKLMEIFNDKTSSDNGCNTKEEDEEIYEKFLIPTKNYHDYSHNLNLLIKQIEKEIVIHCQNVNNHGNEFSTEETIARMKSFKDFLIDVLNNVKHLIPIEPLAEAINTSFDNNLPEYWHRVLLK